MFIAFLTKDKRPLRVNTDRVETYGLTVGGDVFLYVQGEAVYVDSTVEEIDMAIETGRALYLTEAWRTHTLGIALGDTVRSKTFSPSMMRGLVVDVRHNDVTVSWESGTVTVENATHLDLVKKASR